MSLSRQQLRRMILQEIKLLIEGEEKSVEQQAKDLVAAAPKGKKRAMGKGKSLSSAKASAQSKLGSKVGGKFGFKYVKNLHDKDEGVFYSVVEER